MTVFGGKWQDLPDYILGVTKEIWEDRRIHALNDYYAPDIIVRSPASVVVGNRGVIAATMATLAEFPDRALLGEDVIWCADGGDGFLSSHRLISTATHTAPGVYGPACGRRLRYRILADCHVRDGVIDDEWLVRDQSAIVRQMGTDAATFARDLIAKEGGPEACVRPFTPQNDVAGPYAGQGNDNEWGRRYANVLTRIMSADMAAVSESYDRAVISHYPGGDTGHGHAPVDHFWMSLRASFPDAVFRAEHVMGRDDPHMPPRTAIRWSLSGSHSGWGTFGPPTGAEVYVMGISHAEFGSLGAAAPRIRLEHTLTDETAIWKQIYLHTGSHND